MEPVLLLAQLYFVLLLAQLYFVLLLAQLYFVLLLAQLYFVLLLAQLYFVHCPSITSSLHHHCHPVIVLNYTAILSPSHQSSTPPFPLFSSTYVRTSYHQISYSI